LRIWKNFWRGRSQDFIQGPGILAQEPSETGERSRKERAGKRLNHRRDVYFFPQLIEGHDVGRKELKRWR